MEKNKDRDTNRSKVIILADYNLNCNGPIYPLTEPLGAGLELHNLRTKHNTKTEGKTYL